MHQGTIADILVYNPFVLYNHLFFIIHSEPLDVLLNNRLIC